MDPSSRPLRVFFLPFMGKGHMIPAIDMAKLFASRGAQTAIITTPLNASMYSNSIQRSRAFEFEIQVLTINFPFKEAGLPEGCESFDMAASSPVLFVNFFKATTLLEPQVDQILQQFSPDCLVADTFFPWSTDLAAKYRIPRLVFHGTCAFALCAAGNMIKNRPDKKVASDDEPILIPDLPHEIKITRPQLPGYLTAEVETPFTKVYWASKEVENRSFGVVVNSFYELEPAYADYYRNVIGRKSWHIGPVSLCNKAFEDKAERGLVSSVDEHECLKWLDAKKPNSVAYISFGSGARFGSSQLVEIAMGIEASGLDFIWVVKKEKNETEEEEWLPEGFEERIGEKGLIIRGWAPQVLILEHPAIGGFVTHCGWNSTLEAVTAGLPMVTWPLAAEQFYNEKLVTEVLRIGVAVGAKKWGRPAGVSIKRETFENAAKRVMVGEEAEEMRSRAKALGDAARKAVEEGGSSYSDLTVLMEELRTHI